MLGWWKVRRLHKSARTNDLAALQRVLEEGVDPNARRTYGVCEERTPLHVAILNSSVEAAAKLIRARADVHAKCDHHYGSPIRSHPSDSSKRDTNWSSLHLATEVGSDQLIQMICECGLDVDETTLLGRTALHHASQLANQVGPYSDSSQYLRTISTLLAHSADCNARDHKGKTPLFYATETNGSLDATSILLDAGADVNALDNSGQTPLFWADGPGIVEMLLERGANPHIHDYQGWTALKCASLSWIHPHKVELLERFDQ